MKRSGNILRCSIAIFLLGIFLSIHLGKGFHFHFTDATSHLSESDSEKMERSTDCDICDYIIAKDSDHQLSQTNLVAASFPISHATVYTNNIISTQRFYTTNKGPPSLL